MRGRRCNMDALSISRFGQDRFSLILVTLSILGTILILLRLYHGVGVNGDAKYYIELARALAEVERGTQWLLGQTPQLLWMDYTRWGEAPFVFSLEGSALWPPFYSALLAVFGGFAFDARDVAGPLNAVAFGLTIFVTGRLLRSVVRSHLLAALGCMAILFSVTVAWKASWAYSEAVFILLATLALFYASRYLKLRDRSSLIWAAAFAAMACLTRYSGIVLALTLVALILIRSGPTYLDRLRHAGLCLAISIAPLVLWLFRNYHLTDSLTGPSRGSAKGGPFVNHVGRGLSSMEAWNPLMVDIRALALPIGPEVGRVFGVLVAGTVLLVLFTYVLWGVTRWWRGGAEDRRLGCLAVVGSYVFFHVAFTNANAALGNLTLDARQVIPAYVPLVIVIIIGIDMLPDHFRRGSIRALAPDRIRHHGKKALSTVAVTLLAICVGYAGIVSGRDTYGAIFNPEVNWNAYVYNAEHTSVDTAALSEHLKNRVGESAPVARDHFDLYLGDRELLYFRKGCSAEDFARKIELRVVPVNPLHLSGIRKNFGMDILSFYPARQGAMQGDTCLAIAPLPKYDADIITTGQWGDGINLWEVSFHP